LPPHNPLLTAGNPVFDQLLDYIQDKDRYLGTLLNCDPTLMTMFRMLNHSLSYTFSNDEDVLNENIKLLASQTVYLSTETSHVDYGTQPLVETITMALANTSPDCEDNADIISIDMDDIVNDNSEENAFSDTLLNRYVNSQPKQNLDASIHAPNKDQNIHNDDQQHCNVIQNTTVNNHVTASIKDNNNINKDTNTSHTNHNNKRKSRDSSKESLIEQTTSIMSPEKRRPVNDFMNDDTRYNRLQTHTFLLPNVPNYITEDEIKNKLTYYGDINHISSKRLQHRTYVRDVIVDFHPDINQHKLTALNNEWSIRFKSIRLNIVNLLETDSNKLARREYEAFFTTAIPGQTTQQIFELLSATKPKTCRKGKNKNQFYLCYETAEHLQAAINHDLKSPAHKLMIARKSIANPSDKPNDVNQATGSNTIPLKIKNKNKEVLTSFSTQQRTTRQLHYDATTYHNKKQYSQIKINATTEHHRRRLLNDQHLPVTQPINNDIDNRLNRLESMFTTFIERFSTINQSTSSESTAQLV
jgi:hypothetical protein